MNRRLALASLLLLWIRLESAGAVVFEPLGAAIGAVLGTTKASSKTLEGTAFYYVKAKTPGARPEKVAAVEKGVYPPNCTHTWVIGLDPADGKVTQIRVHEFSCHHANPTKAESFLEQFKGIGPGDLAKLDKSTTIAKATGSSVLVREAVKRAVTRFQAGKGTL